MDGLVIEGEAGQTKIIVKCDDPLNLIQKCADRSKSNYFRQYFMLGISNPRKFFGEMMQTILKITMNNYIISKVPVLTIILEELNAELPSNRGAYIAEEDMEQGNFVVHICLDSMVVNSSKELIQSESLFFYHMRNAVIHEISHGLSYHYLSNYKRLKKNTKRIKKYSISLRGGLYELIDEIINSSKLFSSDKAPKILINLIIEYYERFRTILLEFENKIFLEGFCRFVEFLNSPQIMSSQFDHTVVLREFNGVTDNILKLISSLDIFTTISVPDQRIFIDLAKQIAANAEVLIKLEEELMIKSYDLGAHIYMEVWSGLLIKKSSANLDDILSIGSSKELLNIYTSLVNNPILIRENIASWTIRLNLQRKKLIRNVLEQK